MSLQTERTRSTTRTPPALVSVVIPVRNGARTLPEQFGALSAQSYRGRWEVIVVDNGSTDATASLARSWADRLSGLRVVDASDGTGPGFARNVGASEAAGELLAFCDADDIVDGHWLSNMVATATSFDLVGGVQDADLLNDSAVRNSRGVRRSRSLGRPLQFLPFAPTNNLAVWAEVFRAVGGMNPTYRAGEDIEFSWRSQLAGYTLGHAADAIVHYRYRDTTRGVAQQAFDSGWASTRLFRDYRSHGVAPPSWNIVARRWIAMILRLPFLVVPSKRLASVRLLSTNAGKLAASLRFRVLSL